MTGIILELIPRFPMLRVLTDRSEELARPERFELPTSWFVAMRSIQLSYGRVLHIYI
jgi:hypothetical protein